MATLLQDVVDLFLSKISEFDYINMTETMLLEELQPMIKSSCARCLGMNIIPDFKTGLFNRELEDIEQEVLALRMVVAWMNPLVVRIEAFESKLTPKEWNQFSEANHLKEKRETLNMMKKEANIWQSKVDSYRRVQKILSNKSR